MSYQPVYTASEEAKIDALLDEVIAIEKEAPPRGTEGPVYREWRNRLMGKLRELNRLLDKKPINQL